MTSIGTGAKGPEVNVPTTTAREVIQFIEHNRKLLGMHMLTLKTTEENIWRGYRDDNFEGFVSATTLTGLRTSLEKLPSPLTALKEQLEIAQKNATHLTNQIANLESL